MSTLPAAIYLDSYLAPIAPFLAQADVTDIYINRAGEIWTERIGGTAERFEVPELTHVTLARLARQIAAANTQGISREHPLLSARLPDGSRVQIILPPATRGDVAIAIRRHLAKGMSLDDYVQSGALAAATITSSSPTLPRPLPSSCDTAADIGTTLREAVLSRKNILVSGGTSTGKTTFLNALLQEVPAHERLILIEDTAELTLNHANAVGLLAARGSLGEAELTVEDLLIASLRMRPDRIILGEMRGKEALTFLRAVNTGHPGSLSTIHADSPARAIDQLGLLVLQSGLPMEWQDVVRYIRMSVDYVVQLERVAGKRVVTEILAVER